MDATGTAARHSHRRAARHSHRKSRRHTGSYHHGRGGKSSCGESGHQTRRFLILNALYDAMRRVYGGQVRREPADCSEYSDHRPDLTLLLEGLLTVFDLKVFAPIGSDAGEVELRGGFVGFGNTAPHGQLLVHGRRERLGPPATFNPNTGAGYVSPKEGDYARAEALDVRVVYKQARGATSCPTTGPPALTASTPRAAAAPPRECSRGRQNTSRSAWGRQQPPRLGFGAIFACMDGGLRDMNERLQTPVSCWSPLLLTPGCTRAAHTHRGEPKIGARQLVLVNRSPNIHPSHRGPRARASSCPRRALAPWRAATRSR